MFHHAFIYIYLNIHADKEGQIPGTVRAMKWSKCGRFFAATGQDKIVRVWRRAAPSDGLVLEREPYLVLPGHSDEVLTLDWFAVRDKQQTTTTKSQHHPHKHIIYIYIYIYF